MLVVSVCYIIYKRQVLAGYTGCNATEYIAGIPGTSLHVPDPAPHNESSELIFAREFFMGR